MSRSPTRRVHLASYPPREAQLRVALLSLVPQVDEIHLVLNEYPSAPDWLLELPSVATTLASTDLKDEGKFLPRAGADDVVLLCDDDIDYPPDYAERMERALRSYEHLNAVVGVHAVTYPEFFDGRVANREVLTMSRGLAQARAVSQLGTGTVACFGRQLPDPTYIAGSSGYVDVRFARHCFEREMPRVAIEREAGWLRAQDVESSLFDSVTSRWSDEVVRETLTFAGYARLKCCDI